VNRTRRTKAVSENGKIKVRTGIPFSMTPVITRHLSPDADIRHQPFEEARLADGFFDVVISNIPFGNYKPFDRNSRTGNSVIHDYFFAKALDKVRPGGMVLFITSKGTMDRSGVSMGLLHSCSTGDCVSSTLSHFTPL
jgi:adenine-specific DNA methylase